MSRVAATSLAQVVHDSDKLAHENNLGRVTAAVVQHPKTESLAISEEISTFGGDRGERKERYYRHIDYSSGRVNIQNEVNYNKAEATYRSLGLVFPRVKMPEVIDAARTLSEPVSTLTADTGVAQTAEPVAAEEPVAEKPKRTRRRKAAAVAAAPAPAQEEVAATEETDPTDAAAMEATEAPVAEAPQTKPKRATVKVATRVLFDTDTVPHVRHVGGIIRRVLGPDWKAIQENKDCVKDLIYNILHGKVYITNKGSDELLPGFEKRVEDFLAKKLDLVDSTDDIEGL